MAEFDKKIATEAEFYEIIKPFDDVPSEISNGICLRKDKISKYTEKTFDTLNSYTNNQLVPLATFVDVGNADYVLFSFIWEGDGDLDCIVKTSNFDEDYIGIGYGTNSESIGLYGGYYNKINNKPDEIIQWSGDVTSSGGEYFLIDLKKLKEYKTKYKLTNKYFDFDVYVHWYTKPTNISKNVTLKVESIIANDAQKDDKKRFKFTNEKVTKVFEYNFNTKAYFETYILGNVFFYDLVKRIRCFSSFASFLPINFPKIKSLENLTKLPKITVNGVDKSPTAIKKGYDVDNVKSGDKIRIILYPYSFQKITMSENGDEYKSYNLLNIKELGPFNKPSSDILTCNYRVDNDGGRMMIDIDVINFSPEKIPNHKYVSINYYFSGMATTIFLNV